MEIPAHSSSTCPLQGLHMLIPRPQAEKRCRLSELVENLGGTVARFPVIRLSAVPASAEIREAVGNLENYQAIVFASTTGVQFFAQLLPPEARSCLSEHSLVAIGPATAKQIRSQGWFAPRLPNRFDSSGLADLLTLSTRDSRPFLIIRAQQGSAELANRLRQREISFQQLAVYQSLPVEQVDPWIQLQMDLDGFDWVPITSPLIAKHTVRLFGQSLHKTRLASFSAAISDCLGALGFPPQVEAPERKFPSLLQAIADFNAAES